jgi:hypothetical protein
VTFLGVLVIGVYAIKGELFSFVSRNFYHLSEKATKNNVFQAHYTEGGIFALLFDSKISDIQTP